MKTIVIFFALIFAANSMNAFAANEQVRDPFKSKLPAPRGPAQPKAEAQQITAKLDGLSKGPKGSFAVINGQVYREGEEKGGIKVTQIRKREVDILINNVASTLRTVQEVSGTGRQTQEKQTQLEKLATNVNKSDLRRDCGPGEQCV